MSDLLRAPEFLMKEKKRREEKVREEKLKK